ncbi:MAG: glycosyltransferase family 4 protein, partial [Halanaerobiales bacterium]
MLLYTFIISFSITFILTPLTRKLALITGVFDQPNSRRINNRPVPVLGGMAIFSGFTASILIFFGWSRVIAGIILGAGLVLILGIIDDKFEITPLIKLLGQIGAASILIFSGIEIEFITNPFGGMIYLGFWSIPLTILWVVGITNTVNLIDGLDGLAAGV